MSEPTTRIKEDIVHEYPVIGKYRVRVLRKDVSGKTVTSLDVREYVSSEKFEGFTRRGIRLSSLEDVKKLKDELTDIITRGWLQD